MQKRLVFKSKFFRFKHASNLCPLNYFPPCNYISFWPKEDYETISIKCLLNALTLMKISHDLQTTFPCQCLYILSCPQSICYIVLDAVDMLKQIFISLLPYSRVSNFVFPSQFIAFQDPLIVYLSDK